MPECTAEIVLGAGVAGTPDLVVDLETVVDEENASSVHTYTITQPLGGLVEAGDQMVLVFRYEALADTVTGPAGWIEVGDETSGAYLLQVWAKQAGSAEPDPVVTQVSLEATPAQGAVEVWVVRNVDALDVAVEVTAADPVTLNEAPAGPGISIVAAAGGGGARSWFFDDGSAWEPWTSSVFDQLAVWRVDDTFDGMSADQPPGGELVVVSAVGEHACSAVVPDPPTARVELGFSPSDEGTFVVGESLLGGTDVLGGDLGYEWTDVTEWVETESLSFRRGAERSPGPWWRAEVGTASFTLDNNDRDVDRFNPLNAAGPYYPNLRPGIPLRISWVYDDSTTDLQWVGRVDRWDPANIRDLYGTVSVTATDAVERLQAADLAALSTPEGAGDTAGARINRILDRVGWPSSLRDIDTTVGGATMQATTLAQPAWTDVLLTADSDGGLVWIDRRGRLAFRRRTSLPTGPQFTFRADGTGVDYEDVVLSYDRTQVLNIWKLARVGGTEQVAENPASSADNVDGARGFQRSDLICETDGQVSALAAWQLYQFGRLKFRIEAVTVRMLQGVHTDAAWQRIVRADIGDRVRVVHPVPNGGTVDQQALIRGVRWRQLHRGAEVTFSLQIAPTLAANPFVVGESLLGGTDVLTPY